MIPTNWELTEILEAVSGRENDWSPCSLLLDPEVSEGLRLLLKNLSFSWLRALHRRKLLRSFRGSLELPPLLTALSSTGSEP